MWCKSCGMVVHETKCSICGNGTQQDIPAEVYWCLDCQTPVIRALNDTNKTECPLCKGKTIYLCADLRPVFPEERLLFEVLSGKPMKFADQSVWANGSRYYFNGKPKMLSRMMMEQVDAVAVRNDLTRHKDKNSYNTFDVYIRRFVKANQDRLDMLKSEAYAFIRKESASYPHELLVISFSGGKDSTVVADLVVRALGNPSIVHIFGDTTLEFPLTLEYVQRYKKDHPKAIVKKAINKDQDFYHVCEDIGPPSRVMRWCCTMFKTGPITRTLNALFRDKGILTFYGVRKYESVSRSKYNRVEQDSEQIKIQKQTVASPIFYWKDIDIWLYILGEQIDFNDAYRLGYDRVGCWCCPNNSDRSQFLSRIYMPEQAEKWRNFLVRFARQIGKPDAEVYVDSGNWKARQGGYGVPAAEDIKITHTNCTTEENAKIYRLNRPVDDGFYNLFLPFGIVSKELGRKLIREVLVLDMKTNTPILSIQQAPSDSSFDYAVKIKTLNVKRHDDLHRMVSYQIRKFNACRRCLKCESVCKHGAITIGKDGYRINPKKCKRCKMCVTAKYLESGCMMGKYLFEADSSLKEGAINI